MNDQPHDNHEEQDHAMDEAMRRRFGNDSMRASLDRLAGQTFRETRGGSSASSAPSVAGRILPSPRLLALAAVLVLSLLAGVWLYMTILPTGPATGPIALGKVYHEMVDAGFTPGWVCEDESEFIDAFAGRFDQPLTMTDIDLASGLSYSTALGRRTVTVLAHVEGEPVAVFVTTHAGARPVKASRGVKVYSRQIDALVLHEVSPFDTPRLLDAFVAPPVQGEAPAHKH